MVVDQAGYGGRLARREIMSRHAHDVIQSRRGGMLSKFLIPFVIPVVSVGGPIEPHVLGHPTGGGELVT
jgi:hypothetical protein